MTKNEKRKARRLEQRKQRLLGKHCLNCEILLAERLEDSGRSYVYCRKCLTEYKDEARRNRWRRYYKRNRERLRIYFRERARKMRCTKQPQP